MGHQYTPLELEAAIDMMLPEMDSVFAGKPAAAVLYAMCKYLAMMGAHASRPNLSEFLSIVTRSIEHEYTVARSRTPSE